MQQATASPTIEKDAVPVFDLGTARCATGHLRILFHLGSEPPLTRDPRIRLDLVGPPVDLPRVPQIDVHTVVAAGVVTVRAAQTVREIRTPKDREVHPPNHRRPISAGKGTAQMSEVSCDSNH